MIKIAITGPESSGKSTIAQQLSSFLGGCFVKEYAREYLKNGSHYQMEDLIEIANKQYVMNQGKGCEKEILICDTELTVIKIWAMEKFGYCPGEIISLYESQKFDIFFLCKPDMPWQPDPLREDENNRNYLFNLYQEELFLEDEEFVVLQGSEEERLKTALETITAFKG